MGRREVSFVYHAFIFASQPCTKCSYCTVIYNFTKLKRDFNGISQHLIDKRSARKVRLASDFNVAAYALCVIDKVKTEVKAHMTGHHCEAIARFVTKLYTGDFGDIIVTIKQFWEQFKHCQ